MIEMFLIILIIIGNFEGRRIRSTNIFMKIKFEMSFRYQTFKND